VILPVTAVVAVKAAPLPLTPVFHPAKIQPDRTGGVGNAPTFTARVVTVIVPGFASVLPVSLLFLLKVTV
jgi:hypothetical protein